jgi:phage tail-like protein
MYSTELYRNLPQNVRLADEQGLLLHFCMAMQPTYDDILRILSQIEFTFDPEYTESNLLDWYQQLVGLAPLGDRFIGIGLTPTWTPQHKREVIKQAWQYWQRRGTEQGVRDALFMWLQWPHSQQSIYIKLPWGRRPSGTPPQWSGYNTIFGSWKTKRWRDRSHLGGGGAPGTRAILWREINTSTWNPADRLTGNINSAIKNVDLPGSRMGAHATWIYLQPGQAWNQIFPQIFDLDLEAWDIQAQTVYFGWIDGGTTVPLDLRRSPLADQLKAVYNVSIQGFRYTDIFTSSYRPSKTFATSPPLLVGTIDQQLLPIERSQFQAYPILRRASSGSRWNLLIETTDNKVTAIAPTTIFWETPSGDRSTKYSFQSEQSLVLEFLYRPPNDTTLKSYSLQLSEDLDDSLIALLQLERLQQVGVAIRQWIEVNTKDVDPFWVFSDLSVRDSYFPSVSTITASLALAQCLLDVNQASGDPQAKELAILIAETILRNYYGSVPISKVDDWFPVWVLSSGQATDILAPEYSTLVSFQNGIGILPDQAVEYVYKVYSGILRNLSVDSDLLTGQSFRIKSWVNADNITVSAPSSQILENATGITGNILIET